jgi:hypothetical protein
MLNARPTVASYSLSSARLFPFPLTLASALQLQPSRAREQQCCHRQFMQRETQPPQSFLVGRAARGTYGNAPAHCAPAFFKAFRPGLSPALADPFASLQTNSKQLKKVLQDENAMYRSFLDENPKLSQLANDLRLQILQGQDTVALFSCVGIDYVLFITPFDNCVFLDK